MIVAPFNDGETRRIQRNLTGVQKKNNNKTREGVIVNNFIKDNEQDMPTLTLDDTKDSLIISDAAKLPHQLKENQIEPEKSLLPISGIAVGVMGVMAGLSWFVKRNAKITNEIAKEKWITSFTRNISINEETVQALVQMVQNPNNKTIRAGLGVLTLTATAFMGKTFFDGFKEVWVKKKEADIQKNLQEQLIDIETQSFSGKIQIIRNALSEKTKMFSKYLTYNSENQNQPFGMFKSAKELSFGAKQDNKKRMNSGFKYFMLGGATIASIVGLSLYSMKNLRAGNMEVEKFISKTKKDMETIAKSNKDKNFVKEYLEHGLQFINAKKEVVEEIVNQANWETAEKEEFINHVVKKLKPQL